jgi:hypothetical protein
VRSKEEDMNTTKIEDENHLQPFVAHDQKQLVFAITCPACTLNFALLMMRV